MKVINPYLLLAFTITYLFWGTIAVYTQMNQIPFGSVKWMVLFYIIGVIGPPIAGLITSKKFETKEDFKRFVRGCYLPPKQLKWYVFIFVIIGISALLPYVIVGGEQVAPVYYILLNIPLYILIGGLEEVGWRGIMLRELMKRFSLINSTLIVSVAWTAWHLPLFFILGTYQYEHLNISLFMISIISFSLLLSVIFYKTNSVFLCILTHAFYNSMLNVLINKQSILGELIVLVFAIFIFIMFVNNKRTENNKFA